MKAIHTLLVANRGEIAVRIIEAAHELGLRTVAVYAEPDRTAPHVHRADVAVPLTGSTATETYLDQTQLLEAALAQGADAVHPGYGFLSEHAGFAAAVVEAGLTWVGPHPEAIRTMGDKLAAKRIAAQVGVPTLPSAELAGDAEFEWRAQASMVGYPLLVKAAAGGGGRGMRLVADEGELEDAVRSARREALASFGDGTVFAERWLPAPRHIEVQIVADQHGHVIHLGERECSIQRRHQKLVEEAPSTVVDDVLREQLGAAAVELAEAIRYDNVGTVEFLLDAERREFYFLEMNTRIQVEHRVTEEVTGGDLVWWQIQSARGEPLEWTQDDLEIDRHAIEVRLYAEDPARDWLPSTGRITHFSASGSDDDVYVVVDSSIGLLDDGPVDFEVTTHFDPLLAKFTARGYDRPTAIGRLVRYLTGLELHGVTTNRDYLLAVLQHPDFVEGRTTTLFVADHPALLEAGPDPETIAQHALAAGLAADAAATIGHPWAFAPIGWRNVGVAPRRTRFRHRDQTFEVTRTVSSEGRIEATVEGLPLSGQLIERVVDDRTDRRQDHVLLEIDGTTRCYWVSHVGDTWYVNSTSGQTDLVELPRFAEPTAAALAGGPTAPVPGRVVSVEVSPGATVGPGQVLVVLEAMKVEHHVRSLVTATVVDVLVAPGDTVEAHQLLIRLEDAP
ncbi:MAG: acetyl/propionyl/methylcrotonyl-CoA carboxylase subunit alpha [Acidimicrobiales bacterium]